MFQYIEFTRNYNKYKDKIYNFFWYRINFNQSQAEDLTQEVFLKAFKAFNDFDKNKSFQAWIYAIAKNHLKNHWRVAGREVDISEAEAIGISQVGQIEAKEDVRQILKIRPRMLFKRISDNILHVL